MAYAYVYLMASRRNGTLYLGVTSDLVRRIHEHRTGSSGFTARYEVRHLVWFEPHDNIAVAIQRETSLKRWKRAWKIALIERDNPAWRDLWEEIVA
ncbi:MAG TPA: GIY-YIG nuclease family protein [Geminicoccaceae bacterium]|nr:GIY-YIG nuclease family protein [Geminicoccus sp.]HMU50603.1 GIY-YIG nuclease family protein [Geminicoccaceae bacterium]